MNNLELCYPEGAPEGFPVDLFAPTEGGSLVLKEQLLRKKIDALQSMMKDLPQADIPVTNTFSGGVYAREIFIPKGTVLIGKVHLTEHLNICLKGDLTFLTIDGPRRIKAPAMFSAPAGTKKLAYANEDSIWVNVHPALCDDPDKIVDAVTVDYFADYDRLLAKADMEHKVSLFGYTPEQMAQVSENKDTLDDSPQPNVEVRDSDIHGKGLFLTKNVAAGETICLATKDGKRTVAGRYSNHSPNPNCAIKYCDGVYILVSLQNIASGQELTTDYGETLATIVGKGDDL